MQLLDRTIQKKDCPHLEHLFDVPDPPEALFVRGRADSFELLERLPETGLAIVGTRNPLNRSLLLLNQWISALKESGLTIISGMARGIDFQAHRCALQYGLPTIGILGAGLGVPYPTETLEIRETILNSGGLLVSELPLNISPRPFQFLKRNRLIALWSKATLVVEASQKSGALNTARWARDAHRNVYAVPCLPGDPNLAGNQRLLDDEAALPFWGPHSLGSSWIGLSTLSQKKHKPLPERDSNDLFNLILEQTYEQTGVTTEWLISHAQLKGWSTDRLFNAMRELVEKKRVHEQTGLWSCV